MVIQTMTDKFIDHHEYMLSDAIKIKKSYEGMQAENRIIITTEKDAVKLMASRFQEILGELPIYYLPINVKFHQPDEVEFNEQIINYVRNNKIDSGIHKK